MPNVEPYLLWNGDELVDALRTLTYLRRGLGGSGWEVAVDPTAGSGPGTTTIIDDIYVDVYDDVYGGTAVTTYDPFWTGSLACYCALTDTGPYVSPADDPAPWYDPARPESGDFLGFWPDVELLNPAKRVVTSRSSGGGSVSALGVGPRLVQVTGLLYAGSKAGMDWGELWLKQVLAGTDGCDGDTLTLLPTCPPDDVDDPSTYLRELRHVALVDGPTFGDAGVHRDVAQTVAFQLAAGDPYLRRVVSLLALTALTGAPIVVAMSAPAVVGDAAMVLTVEGPVADLVVSLPDGSAFEVDLDAGETLVVDASDQTVSLNGSSGGLDALTFTGLLRWITAATGTTATVTLTPSGAGGFVAVDAVYREL